ncbi:MAG: imidazolonepropionase, partial [Pseudomonadota bacterium]
MHNWDVLITDANIATLDADASGYGELHGAALAIVDGNIAWLGSNADVPAHTAATEITAEGQWLTPALIDCHTHLVFAGDRAEEYEQRLAGVSYEQIARAGGGILSTVRATRSASHEELLQASLPRLQALINDGVATVEIKSGYGLDVESEIRMLEVARELGNRTGVAVVTTLLAAHAIPPEFKNDADGYIALVCDELLPEVAARGLADSVDAYCESIAFSAEQTARVFETAAQLNLPVRLHADQLSDTGGASLAARYSALTADHLEYTSADGVAAMAAAGTTAVMVPGAFVTLGETQQPPIETLRKHGVPIAVATDCNPGTSPLTSLREAMALASRVFGLTPTECLAGTTREAARALGLLDSRGTLEIGKRADLAIWDVAHPRDLSYWLGRPA